MAPCDRGAQEESKAAASSQVIEEIKEENQTYEQWFEEGRKFFCSELIVKIYKVCNILSVEDFNKACKNYWP